MWERVRGLNEMNAFYANQDRRYDQRQTDYHGSNRFRLSMPVRMFFVRRFKEARTKLQPIPMSEDFNPRWAIVSGVCVLSKSHLELPSIYTISLPVFSRARSI